MEVPVANVGLYCHRVVYLLTKLVSHYDKQLKRPLSNATQRNHLILTYTMYKGVCIGIY